MILVFLNLFLERIDIDVWISVAVYAEWEQFIDFEWERQLFSGKDNFLELSFRRKDIFSS